MHDRSRISFYAFVLDSSPSPHMFRLPHYQGFTNTLLHHKHLFVIFCTKFQQAQLAFKIQAFVLHEIHKISLHHLKKIQ